MVFLGRPSHRNHQQQIGNNRMGQVPAFKYFGIIFQANRIGQEQIRTISARTNNGAKAILDLFHSKGDKGIPQDFSN